MRDNPLTDGISPIVSSRTRGYHTEEIRVVTDNGETGAYTYVADESAVDDSLRPYSWYKELVVKGARQHSLPDNK